ncbi:sulfatase [uncultured Paludibaculum sp.]|uniref:sulfatase n=1 Tax=uncultured Paludibaculum sp. TaxID=1765020 RepID=UPI002AAAB104|nr:sulfatase [uncultured Paludibaculum sp.]
MKPQQSEFTRRGFLSTAAALPALGAQPPNTRGMNVLFILADDLGWADLACYGSSFHETPNLDAFARTAIQFTNAYASAPVCSPTRAALLTGKSPARLGMTTWHEASMDPPLNRPMLPAKSDGNLPLSEISLAKLYRQAGYRTAHVGKWHLGTAGYYPEAHGFDLNVGGTFWGAPQTFFYPFSGDQRYGGEFRYVPGLSGAKAGDYLPDLLAGAVLNELEDHGGKPFFLNYWDHSVHTPIEAPQDLVEKFQRKLQPHRTHRNPAYAAMLARYDYNVGRVLDHLRTSGLDRNTIVVFTSDNGGYTEKFDGVQVTNNLPLRSGKGALYEGGLRVPLMIRVPGLTPAGATCDAPVISTDFYPTLQALSGLGVGTRTLDGVSIADLLANPGGRPPERDLCFHFPHYYPTTTPVSAIRAGSWKLLEYLDGGQVELYDLREDPGEIQDVSTKLPDVVRTLRQRLAGWRNDVGARMPAVNPDFKSKIRETKP